MREEVIVPEQLVLLQLPAARKVGLEREEVIAPERLVLLGQC